MTAKCQVSSLCQVTETVLLSSGETAARLGKSVRTIARMAVDGRLAPVQRIGERGAFLFSADDVEKLRAELLAKLGVAS